MWNYIRYLTGGFEDPLFNSRKKCVLLKFAGGKQTGRRTINYLLRESELS